MPNQIAELHQSWAALCGRFDTWNSKRKSQALRTEIIELQKKVTQAEGQTDELVKQYLQQITTCQDQLAVANKEEGELDSKHTYVRDINSQPFPVHSLEDGQLKEFMAHDLEARKLFKVTENFPFPNFTDGFNIQKAKEGEKDIIIHWPIDSNSEHFLKRYLGSIDRKTFYSLLAESVKQSLGQFQKDNLGIFEKNHDLEVAFSKYKSESLSVYAKLAKDLGTDKEYAYIESELKKLKIHHEDFENKMRKLDMGCIDNSDDGIQKIVGFNGTIHNAASGQSSGVISIPWEQKTFAAHVVTGKAKRYNLSASDKVGSTEPIALNSVGDNITILKEENKGKKTKVAILINLGDGVYVMPKVPLSIDTSQWGYARKGGNEAIRNLIQQYSRLQFKTSFAYDYLYPYAQQIDEALVLNGAMVAAAEANAAAAGAQGAAAQGSKRKEPSTSSGCGGGFFSASDKGSGGGEDVNQPLQRETKRQKTGI